MEPVEASARPRVGLLGNPSDLYGGAVIAFAFDAFRARARVSAGEALELSLEGGERLRCTSWPELLGAVDPRSCPSGPALCVAAAHALARRCPELAALPADDARSRLELEVQTDIPRQVGLAGSSAIVVSVLRALSNWFERPLSPFELAELALAAESEELGLLAGPQDRVAQAYEGLLHMDFSGRRSPESYTQLSPALLPPLFLAWDPCPGESSGAVHARLRERFDAGEELVVETLDRFPRLVREGLAALRSGERERFSELVDENMDTRSRIFAIAERDLEIALIARGHGASATLAGSGGALVGALPDETAWPALATALKEAGYRVLRPKVAAPARAGGAT